MDRYKEYREQRKRKYKAKDVVYQVMKSINELPIAELEKMADAATMPFRADLFRAMITYKEERDKTYSRNYFRKGNDVNTKDLVNMILGSAEDYFKEVYRHAKVNYKTKPEVLLQDIDKVIAYEKAIYSLLLKLRPKQVEDEVTQAMRTLTNMRTEVENKIEAIGTEIMIFGRCITLNK
ncbi:TPA: hypothetical protein ACJ51R_001655 [Streptococcus suis]